MGLYTWYYAYSKLMLCGYIYFGVHVCSYWLYMCTLYFIAYICISKYSVSFMLKLNQYFQWGGRQTVILKQTYVYIYFTFRERLSELYSPGCVGIDTHWQRCHSVFVQYFLWLVYRWLKAVHKYDTCIVNRFWFKCIVKDRVFLYQTG